MYLRDDSSDEVDAERSLSRAETLSESRFDLTTIQGDVEQLIDIAAQLFAAIEQQIHDLELDLTSTRGAVAWGHERTMFKEQLIRSSLNLDSSLQTIANHLGHPSFESTDFSSNGRRHSID